MNNAAAKYDAETTRAIFSAMNQVPDARIDKVILSIARTGDIDLLESILKHGDIGASYNATDKDNFAVSYAIVPLLECAADKTRAKEFIKEWFGAFGGRNKSTMNDFLFSVADVDVLRGLLALGADPNRTGKHNGRAITPLLVTLENERADLSVAMMEHLLLRDEIPMAYKERSIFCDFAVPETLRKAALYEKIVRHFENMELPESWRKRIGTAILHATKKHDDPYLSQKFLSGSGSGAEVQLSLMSMAVMTPESWTKLLERDENSRFCRFLVGREGRLGQVGIDSLKVSLIENMKRDGVDIANLYVPSRPDAPRITLLHASVAKNNPVMTSALLSAGADPDKTVVDNGKTITAYDVDPGCSAALSVLHAWRAKQAMESVLKKAQPTLSTSV